MGMFHGRNIAGRDVWELRLGAEFFMVLVFSGGMYGGGNCVGCVCPDPWAGLQVSTCSGYDLGHPG